MLKNVASRILLRTSLPELRILTHGASFAFASSATPPSSCNPEKHAETPPAKPIMTSAAPSESAKRTEPEPLKKPEEDIRTKILYVGLLRAMDDGWTRDTLQKSARDVGYQGSIDVLFPQGAIELVKFARGVWLKRMKQGLEEEAKKYSGKLPVSEWVYRGLRLQLELTVPYKKTWYQVMLLGLEPGNILRSFGSLNRVFDLIWRYAGDKSIDLSYYSKRLATASIYMRAELFMLFDTSKDHEETWKFLHSLVDSMINRNDILKWATLSTTDLPKIASGVCGVASQFVRDWVDKNKPDNKKV